MNRAMLGALVGAGLVMAGLGLGGPRNEVLAQHASQAAASGGELIALPMPADKGQLLAVIDPRQQTIGVYHVDATTGKIALVSVRTIRWDLQMSEFNGVNPLPREIRLQLEQRN